MQSLDCRASIAEHRLQSLDCRASIAEPRLQSLDCRASIAALACRASIAEHSIAEPREDLQNPCEYLQSPREDTFYLGGGEGPKKINSA